MGVSSSQPDESTRLRANRVKGARRGNSDGANTDMSNRDLAASQLLQELDSSLALPSTSYPDMAKPKGAVHTKSERKEKAARRGEARLHAEALPAAAPSSQTNGMKRSRRSRDHLQTNTPADDAPGPLDALFPPSPVRNIPSPTYIQVPGTQASGLTAVDGPVHPNISSHIVPASSVEGETSMDGADGLGSALRPPRLSPSEKRTIQVANADAYPATTPKKPKPSTGGKAARKLNGFLATQPKAGPTNGGSTQVVQSVSMAGLEYPSQNDCGTPSSSKSRRSYTWSSTKRQPQDRDELRGVDVDPEVGPSAEPGENLAHFSASPPAHTSRQSPSPLVQSRSLNTAKSKIKSKKSLQAQQRTIVQPSTQPSFDNQWDGPMPGRLLQGSTQTSMAPLPEAWDKSKKRKNNPDEIEEDTDAKHPVAAEHVPVEEPRKVKRRKNKGAESEEDLEAKDTPAAEDASAGAPRKVKTKKEGKVTEAEEETDAKYPAAALEAAVEAPPKSKKKKNRRVEPEEVAAPEELTIPESQRDETDESSTAPQEKPKRKKRNSKVADVEASKGSPETKKSRKARDSVSRISGAPLDAAGGRRGVRTGAEVELSIEHMLSDPPKLKDGGEFTDDEAELIRRQIKQYQYSWNLDVDDLVRLIQFTKPYRTARENTELEQRQSQASSKFWKDVYDTLPRRRDAQGKAGTTSIQRYVRRRYHNYAKGAGGWDEEEDKLLLKLIQEHAPRWKNIALLMGDRSETACRDRWRNYLQYGDGRNVSFWEDDEEARLKEAVANVIELMKKAREDEGKAPLPQYTSREINWQLVSEKVGTRSRLQCSMKWKTLQDADDRMEGKVQKKKTAKEPKPRKLDGATKTKTRKSESPGFRKMRWGDKLDVIVAISACSYESEGDVDWKEVHRQEEVLKEGNSIWSSKDRKAVLKELHETVGEQEDFASLLNAIVQYLETEHGAQLEDHYDPEIDANGGYDEERAAEKDAKARAQKEKRSEGKKRRRESEKVERESKKWKSSELITASDDED